jgi:hypothetical protein
LVKGLDNKPLCPYYSGIRSTTQGATTVYDAKFSEEILAEAAMDDLFAAAEREQERQAFLNDPYLDVFGPDARCESGWTGDRCTFKLFHEGPHSND